MEQHARILIDIYRESGEVAASRLLECLLLMESPNPKGGQFKKGGGHEPAGTPDTKSGKPSEKGSKPTSPAKSSKPQTTYAKLAARHAKSLDKGHEAAVRALKSRELSRKKNLPAQAELVGAALLGHSAIGRSNTGQSRNAFDTSSGRRPDGSLDLGDVKTSHDPHGLAFKDASRRNQFRAWRKAEQQEPGKTRAFQLVIHAGPKDTAPGVYVVPGIPMKGNVPLKKAGARFDPADPERPIKVSDLADVQELKDPKRFAEVQKKVQAAVNSIDPKRLNKTMKKNYDEHVARDTDERLADPEAAKIVVKRVASNKGAMKTLAGNEDAVHQLADHVGEMSDAAKLALLHALQQDIKKGKKK